jgi:hypothetical protein
MIIHYNSPILRTADKFDSLKLIEDIVKLLQLCCPVSILDMTVIRSASRQISLYDSSEILHNSLKNGNE